MGSTATVSAVSELPFVHAEIPNLEKFWAVGDKCEDRVGVLLAQPSLDFTPGDSTPHNFAFTTHGELTPRRRRGLSSRRPGEAGLSPRPLAAAALRKFATVFTFSIGNIERSPSEARKRKDRTATPNPYTYSPKCEVDKLKIPNLTRS